jgi:hypothetical protein
MLQGTCIEGGQSAVLEKGKEYFLFPNGPDHYYVSRFPNENAHTGCFQAKYFQLIDEEDLVMPEIDREKVYIAHMYRKEGYPGLELKEYFIEAGKTHCYLYEDRSLKKCKGCFPLEWLTDFEEIVPETVESDQIVEETVHKLDDFVQETGEFEQLSLF